MTKLFQTFVKLKLIRLTPYWIRLKIEANDIEAIIFGAQYGIYYVRIPAVEYLSKFDSDISRKALIIAIDDPIKKFHLAQLNRWKR